MSLPSKLSRGLDVQLVRAPWLGLILLSGLLCAGCVGVTNPNNSSGSTQPAVAPLSVSITSPASGATVSGTITVTATASTNVTGVQFDLNGASAGPSVTAAPFSLSLNTATLSNGGYTLTAVASAAGGQTTTSAGVSIKVSNSNSAPSNPTPTPSSTSPSVSITSPATGATVSGTITVTANASTNTTGVQLNVDGGSAGPAITRTPFSFSLNTATLSNGNHVLTAVGSTAAGQTATSAGVSINVQNAPSSPSAPTPPSPPATRGATLPYVEYEAENASYSGTLIGPSTTTGDMASEASGREAVTLTATGQYVTFTATQPANSLVVRYSIPDSTDGTGISSTLSIYVNGVFEQKLPVTSKYSWAYDRLAYENPKVPNAATAHHFFDEAHTLINQVPTGATITVQRDADDTAAFYVIDLIDLEQVGPPIAQPTGSLSLTNCGADPTGVNDSSTNIQNCINQAETSGQILYIPQGTFLALGGRLNINNVTVQGAGMWYSMITGVGAGFGCGGGTCAFHDFALFGGATFRTDTEADKIGGFDGTSGPGSVLDSVWVEHSNNGYWIGSNTNGLTVENSRIRDTFADGVNFNCGSINNMVQNTELRYNGDDALAVWSNAGCGNGPTNNTTFQFNTVQLPWNAHCFAAYGGGGNTFEDNLCYDPVIEGGILVAQAFTSTPFTDTTSFLRTTLTRAGGPYGGDTNGALKVEGRDGPLAEGTIQAENIDIVNAVFCGIEFEGPNAINNVSLSDITISSPGTWGIQVDANANGAVTMSGIVVTNPPSGGITNAAGAAFNIIRGSGDVGW